MMEYFRRERELLSTFQQEVYIAAKKKLDESKVAYRTTFKYTGNVNRIDGILGRIGQRSDLQIQYQIFVKKKDLEFAEFVLNRHGA